MLPHGVDKLLTRYKGNTLVGRLLKVTVKLSATLCAQSTSNTRVRNSVSYGGTCHGECYVVKEL